MVVFSFWGEPFWQLVPWTASSPSSGWPLAASVDVLRLQFGRILCRMGHGPPVTFLSTETV